MKNKVGKITAKIAGFMFVTMVMLSVTQADVYAAGSVTVVPDKNSVAMGESLNVTIQTSTPEDPASVTEVAVTYDANILTVTGCNVEYGGGGGLLTFKGQSALFTFTAAGTGNVNISAEAIIDDDGANPATAATVVTVGASVQGDLSSDATLHVLEMNPGQLVPEFSSDVTEYKILIGNDVTDITVSGAVSDPNAQITAASGFKNLKEGTNQAIITVTAEDGTTCTYRFTIERGEAQVEEEEQQEQEEPVSVQTSQGLDVTIDDVSYRVQTTISEEMLPEGCVKTSSSFNGQTVEAALFEKGGMTLLYLLTADGASGEYFIYNESTGNMQLFVQLRSIENRFIVPIPAQETPVAGFTSAKLQWNNSYLPAYVLEDRSAVNAEEFYLLYAVSSEGQKGFYLYDTMEGTYQRFLNYTGAETSFDGAQTGVSKMALIVIIALGALLIVAIILIVNLIIRNKEMQDDEPAPKKQKKNHQETLMKAGAAEKKPIEKKPVEKKPTEKKPTEKKSTEKKPTEKKPTEKKPTEKNTAEKKTMENMAAEEKPVAEKKPVARKVVTPQPEAETVQKTKRPQPVREPRVTTSVQEPGNAVAKVTMQPQRPEARRAAVPIYTLERPPVQLTREAPPDQLDDDFEFEFINIDNE